MIRAAATISPDRDPNDRLHRELPLRQIAGLRDLGHQLVEPRINIIGKLDLHDRLCPNRTHPNRRPDNIRFLYSGIEYAGVPELLRERRRLTEDPAQPPPYILTIQQCFRILLHQLPD